MPRLLDADSRCRLLPWRVPPLAVLAAWPREYPLIMVHSGRWHPRWARWSILASPSVIYRFAEQRSELIACNAAPLVATPLGAVRFVDDPLVDLDALLAATRTEEEHAALPFAGGWIGLFSYDLGRLIEPMAAVTPGMIGAANDRRWPLIELAYCPDALIYDRRHRTWHALGEPWPGGAPLPEQGDLVARAAAMDDPPPRWPRSPTTSLPREDYTAAVARVIEYIRAGDIFQANLTQRLTFPFSGSTRHLARAGLASSGAWYGAYLELPDDRCALSLSPELFLEVDRTDRSVVTRPVKGTRPGHVPRRELADSAKDAAELNMIIDLLRNDLGRVCAYGSVQVSRRREIETHPTVHHGVGEVRGVLRPSISTGDLLRATFPGGSITGAPKIRAMQIIDELEPVRRGPYCGALGWISNGGRLVLNVAIRTLLLQGERPPDRFDRLDGTMDYGAGGGIVADSDPEAEYEESLTKAAILDQLPQRP